MNGNARAPDPQDFGRVAVLLGGWSAEREISLLTGAAVLAALQRRGVDAHPVDAARDLVGQLQAGRFDRAWNALHGPGGEDGVVQGALECLGVPYTGSGVLASALCMDKLRSKQLFQACGLGTPPFRVLHGPQDFAACMQELGLPLCVKPAAQGSSVGMHKVEHSADLQAAWEDAMRFGAPVLAESWIQGEEYTAGVLDATVLPLIRIETPRTFYDYEAKYFADSTRYYCPAGLDAARESALAAQCMQAFLALGCSGWGRVDFLLDAQGHALFLEVNTIPGMTDHSLVPMAARQYGLDFDELVLRILATSLARAPAGGSP